MTLPSSSTSVAETMARLSSKSGVTATIAIERTTSTVLQSTGTLGNMFASSASASIVAPGQTAPATSPSTERDGPVLGTSDSGEEQSFKDFAKMVWNYVNATGQLVHDMDAEVRRWLYTGIMTICIGVGKSRIGTNGGTG